LGPGAACRTWKGKPAERRRRQEGVSKLGLWLRGVGRWLLVSLAWQRREGEMGGREGGKEGEGGRERASSHQRYKHQRASCTSDPHKQARASDQRLLGGPKFIIHDMMMRSSQITRGALLCMPASAAAVMAEKPKTKSGPTCASRARRGWPRSGSRAAREVKIMMRE
jgi:hypothetical protein